MNSRDQVSMQPCLVINMVRQLSYRATTCNGLKCELHAHMIDNLLIRSAHASAYLRMLHARIWQAHAVPSAFTVGPDPTAMFVELLFTMCYLHIPISC